MSRQTTLFNTWGGSSTNVDSTANIIQAEADFDLDDDLQLTEQDLEQLCDFKNDFPSSLPPHSKQLQTSSFHVGPSRSFLNSSIIEEEIPGFDNEAGQLWIYPTNYPVRDYQYNIIHKALFANTLVCLPTGLGKTFIAAVVMYNFYRWYPSGKVVFLAPTKPLVAQQIEACHNVMGIPQDHLAEMTGQIPPKVRTSTWHSKRVFFLTPQVMQNDLQKSTCPGRDVCCVVFDEAHKALGNHAYSQVVKQLSSCKVRFRVLALSATPGNDLKAVQQVVSNLQIGTIELRSEDSIDIQRYSHERRVDKMVVALDGEIMDVKNNFARVLTGVLNRLIRYGVMYPCTPDRLSKFQLLQARDQFRVTGASSGVLPGTVEGDFASAISLFHAYELLLLHGMKSFYQFLTNTFSAGGHRSKAKIEILRNPQFGCIVKRLKERVDSSERNRFMAGKPTLVFPRMSGKLSKAEDATEDEKNSFFYSHPKLGKLEDIVLGHFRDFQDDQLSDGVVNTRVMIFSQYRDSVQEITDMLNRHAPVVRVMSFVGHSTGKSSSKGLTQREQTEIVSNFREGGYNTLVATCVGEEGLDIGDVDLIVCFDAPKSPIRLVQRMGRTGRKRKGRIVMIVTEGKEEQVYNKSQSNKKSIHRAISNGCKTLTYYQHCHRMVPKHVHPQVHKMYMVVNEFVSSRKPKKESTVPHFQTTSMESKIKFVNGGKKAKRGTYLNEQELSSWSDRLSLTDREFKTLKKSVTNCFSQEPLLCLPSLNGCPDRTCEGPKSRSINNTPLNSSVGRINAVFSLNLNRWVNYQTSMTPLNIVGPSRRTEHFLSSLKFIDVLRTSEEDMGHIYDLEMESYLDRNDVKLVPNIKKPILESENRIKNKSMSFVSPLIKCAPDRNESKSCNAKTNCRRKQVFDFSSDDEDFVSSEKVSDKSDSKKLIPSPVRLMKCFTPESTDHQELDNVDNIQGSPSSINNLDSTSLTQHVIPRAPFDDALDWLDELEPTQMSTPHLATSPALNLGLSPVLLSSEHRQRKRRDCEYECFSESGIGEFATPKAPSRRHKPLYKYSTPAVVNGSCVKIDPVNETSAVIDGFGSIDLFEDVSAGALLADFSQSRVEVSNTTSKSPNSLKQSKTCDVNSNPAGTEQGVEQTNLCMLRDSADNQMDPVVIEESDLEPDDKGSCDSDDKTSGLRTMQPQAGHDGANITVQHDNAYTPSEDSFLTVQKQCRKRPRKRRNNFLQSPTTSCSSQIYNVSEASPETKQSPSHTPRKVSNSPSLEFISSRRKKLKVTFASFDEDTSGEEFDMPLSKRIAKSSHRNTRTTVANRRLISPSSALTETDGSKKNQVNEFLEEEAEQSFDGGSPEAGSSQSELDEYDCDDSFINDNSMLTQISPSQRLIKTSKVSKAQANSHDFYLKSLLSPDDHLFGGERRGCGTKYRMVFSQRHKLLNHYISKAGFKVAVEGRSKQRKATGRERRLDDKDLFETDSSQSEAEEVNVPYGEEELCQSLEPESDQSMISLKESSAEGRENQNMSSMDKHSLMDRRTTVPLAGMSIRDGYYITEPFGKSGSSVSKVWNTDLPLLSVDGPDTVIISPSLLASVKIRPTPSCFSLGMDEWIEY